MTDVAHILGEFIAAWQAGDRPRLPDFLQRVPAADRDELAEQIQTYLFVAPEPEYDEATWTAMTADPMVATVAAASMEPEPWPQLLPRLRERARLSLADVAGRLGLRPELAPKAEQLLGEMESGELDPSLPTHGLLERLARILGVTTAALDWRGGAPAGPGAPLLYRSTAEDADYSVALLSEALVTDAGDWDEADELFLGGR
jgi:transcriptional regulator with XRE-family HTH domain